MFAVDCLVFFFFIFLGIVGTPETALAREEVPYLLHSLSMFGNVLKLPKFPRNERVHLDL